MCDRATQRSKQARKRFAVFQSSFQHCFHLKFYLSTTGTSPLRGAAGRLSFKFGDRVVEISLGDILVPTTRSITATANRKLRNRHVCHPHRRQWPNRDSAP